MASKYKKACEQAAYYLAKYWDVNNKEGNTTNPDGFMDDGQMLEKAADILFAVLGKAPGDFHK